MDNFKAILVITLLTWAAVIVSGTTQKLSTTTDDTVSIPCLFGDGTLLYILWYYNDGTGPRNILKLDKEELTIAAGYANRASLHDDYSTLILKEITVADEGTFHCVVHRLGQTAVPHFKTKLNVFSLRPDTLPVISPCTRVDEFSSCSIHANQSVTLTCTLPNVYPVKNTELMWYQDGKHVSSINDVTQNGDGTTDISRQFQMSKTGNFTCNATYLSVNGRENTAVSVQTWIIPPSDEPNTQGENTMSGQVAGMTTLIVLLVGCFLAIITFSLYYSKTIEKRSPTDESDIKDMFNVIADKIQDDDILRLGKELGFDETYLSTNSQMNRTCDRTLAMLTDWDETLFKEKELAALEKALLDSGLRDLAHKVFSEESSTLGKSSNSTERQREDRSKHEEDITTPLIAVSKTITSTSTATTTTPSTPTTNSPQTASAASSQPSE